MVFKLSQIQDKGQITIPKEAREKLSLKKGDTIHFEIEEDALKILPMQVAPRVKRVGRALNDIGKTLKEKGVSDEELLEGYQKILDGQLRKIYPKLFAK